MAVAPAVHSFLSQRDVEYELVPHPRAYSTRDNASRAHVREDHIAKAVIVKNDGDYLMVVIPGNAWVKLDALREQLGRQLNLAPEHEITPLFPDCQPGAIPPLGKPYGMETCLDEALTTLANVYFEAGDHEDLVHMSGVAFCSLLRGARQGHFSHE